MSKKKNKNEKNNFKLWVDRLGILLVITLFVVCLYMLLFKK
jgi:hypothetical protein